MRARTLTCLLAGVAALALSACGDPDAESVSNDVLTQRVGQSSTTLKRLLDRRVDSEAQQFTVGQTTNALTILGGDLSAVDSRDVADLLRIQQRAVRVSKRALAELRDLKADYSQALIDVEADERSASSGVKKFVSTYNSLVVLALGQVASWSKQMTVVALSNRVCVQAWEAVIAFQRTGQTGHLRKTLTAARRALQRVVAVGQKASAAQSLEQRLNQAATPLVEQANGSPEVSRLIETVRDRYPHSVLNDLVVKPSGS